MNKTIDIKAMSLEAIKAEDHFRKDKFCEGYLEVWSNRLNLLKLSGDAKNIILKKRSGMTTLYDEMKEHIGTGDKNDLKVAQFERFINSLCFDLKYSKRKEKFYRFAYNGNVNECKKLHTKLQKMESDKLDELMELDKKGETFKLYVDNRVNGGSLKGHKQSDGMNVYAKDIKRFYEIREDFINQLNF